MAKKFVRNITGTVLKGENKEPLFTNLQNDLLSDDEDVAVRNKKEYHFLTDNLKTHLVKTNAFMSISEKEKNGLKLNVLQASDTEVKNAVDTPRVINPKQAKDMIEQRTPKIVRDIIETDVPQSDWDETDPKSKAFIRNKPDIENGGGGESIDLTDYIKGKNIQAMPGMDGISVTHATSPETSVGLSLNFANQKESETGTETYKPMNSKGVKQAIDKQVPLIVADQATSIIEKNFEKLPQPDWNETNQETHGFIKNKPNIKAIEDRLELIDMANRIRVNVGVDKQFITVMVSDPNGQSLNKFFENISFGYYYKSRISSSKTITVGEEQVAYDLFDSQFKDENGDHNWSSSLEYHFKTTDLNINDISKIPYLFYIRLLSENIDKTLQTVPIVDQDSFIS